MFKDTQQKDPVAYNYVEEVPIKCNIFSYSDEDRTCTDVFCTIIGVVFSLVLLIFAFTWFNWGNSYIKVDTYVKTHFPTDSSGALCGVDD